jgi:hypothetical protein
VTLINYQCLFYLILFIYIETGNLGFLNIKSPNHHLPSGVVPQRLFGWDCYQNNWFRWALPRSILLFLFIIFLFFLFLPIPFFRVSSTLVAHILLTYSLWSYSHIYIFSYNLCLEFAHMISSSFIFLGVEIWLLINGFSSLKSGFLCVVNGFHKRDEEDG